MNTPKIPERTKYPFSKMEIGDYINMEMPDESAAMKARIAAGTHGHYAGKKFVTRITGRVIEVWRKS